MLDDAIIRQASTENITIECIPFIHTKPVETLELQQQINQLIHQTDYVIFTSANAVNAVAKQVNTKETLNAFCISGKTRKAVEQHFSGSRIIADAATGAELAEKIIEFVQSCHSSNANFTFFCGNKRLNTIPETFKKNNLPLTELVVYDTILTPQTISKQYDGVLFFSPSAVDSFIQMNQPDKNLTAFSFAGATYTALQPIAAEIVVSHTPSEQAMLNTVMDYYKEHFNSNR